MKDFATLGAILAAAGKKPTMGLLEPFERQVRTGRYGEAAELRSAGRLGNHAAISGG
jgi:hypothetical protein